jgi:hypothetical protein
MSYGNIQNQSKLNKLLYWLESKTTLLEQAEVIYHGGTMGTCWGAFHYTRFGNSQHGTSGLTGLTLDSIRFWEGRKIPDFVWLLLERGDGLRGLCELCEWFVWFVNGFVWILWFLWLASKIPQYFPETRLNRCVICVVCVTCVNGLCELCE